MCLISLSQPCQPAGYSRHISRDIRARAQCKACLPSHYFCAISRANHREFFFQGNLQLCMPSKFDSAGATDYLQALYKRPPPSPLIACRPRSHESAWELSRDALYRYIRVKYRHVRCHGLFPCCLGLSTCVVTVYKPCFCCDCRLHDLGANYLQLPIQLAISNQVGSSYALARNIGKCGMSKSNKRWFSYRSPCRHFVLSNTIQSLRKALVVIGLDWRQGPGSGCPEARHVRRGA